MHKPLQAITTADFWPPHISSNTEHYQCNEKTGCSNLMQVLSGRVRKTDHYFQNPNVWERLATRQAVSDLILSEDYLPS